MKLTKIAALLTLSASLQAAPPSYPTKYFQGEGKIVQVLAMPPKDEEFRGFYVLEEGGRIHHVPGAPSEPVRLDDGKPAEVIWFDAGRLFRLRVGAIEQMGDLPQEWARAPLGVFAGRLVESLWPEGGWAQLEDGTILKLSGKEPPYSVGRHLRIRSAVEETLVLEDGSILLAREEGVWHRAIFDPKPVWAARTYGGALSYLDEAGRLNVIRKFPGSLVSTLSSRPRLEVPGVVDAAMGKMDEAGEVLLLREDGSLLRVDYFYGHDAAIETDVVLKIPGAIELETLEYGFPETLVALIATEGGGVFGIADENLRPPGSRWRSDSFRSLYRVP